MRRFILFFLIIGLFGTTFIVIALPLVAQYIYGPPSPNLSTIQLYQYSAKLLWFDGILTQPGDPFVEDISFRIEIGESVSSIASRLRDIGLISNVDAFNTYLIYSGLDMSIQAGEYHLKPAMSMIDIARKFQDATPTQIRLVILPGWRMEEIAAGLSTSGLTISDVEFLTAAQTWLPGFDFLSGATTTEGFLFPDVYLLPRGISAGQLVNEMVRNFALHLSIELRDSIARQQMDVYDAVILASIVQREAVHPEEQPIIASVFLNRLKIGMRLETDPTIQYAIGYNTDQQTWWKNPLTVNDLALDSPFNTYLYPGLPPAPIDNPGLEALKAVAYPAQTPYYYFRARCDGSGYHVFAETLKQHIQNGCQG
jgi:UPF0755 protein